MEDIPNKGDEFDHFSRRGGRYRQEGTGYFAEKSPHCSVIISDTTRSNFQKVFRLAHIVCVTAISHIESGTYV